MTPEAASGPLPNYNCQGGKDMESTLSRRVRTAAVAGWWTLLVAAAFATAAWLMFTGFMCRQPAWILKLWGGVTYEGILPYALWAFTVYKVFIWMLLLVTVWLSLWARGLRRAGL